MPRLTPRQVSLAAVLALSLHSAAFAQVQPLVPPPLSVQRLAPQLVAFAGSQANFQNLVNGLTFGTPVQLTSVLPDGSTQVVTFTPTGQMSPSDIARTLEAARQQLISFGIGAPTAEQISTVLMGGLVPTALGGTQVAGQLNSAAGGATAVPSTITTGSTATTGSNGVTVQTTPAASTRVNTSDSLIAPGATSRSPAQATPTPAPGQTPTQVTASPIAGATATTPAPASTPSANPTTPAATPAPQNAPLRR